MQVYDGDDLHEDQRSNVVNFALWLPESLMQVLNNDDLHGYVILTNASA